jgi:hypothetical protein
MGSIFDGSNSETKMEQLSLLSQAWHNAPIGKLFLREDGTLVFPNKTICNKLRLPEGQVSKQSFYDLIAGENTELKAEYKKLSKKWFGWEKPITLHSHNDKPFVIWGWDESLRVHSPMLASFPLEVVPPLVLS